MKPKTLKDLEFECEWNYNTLKALKQEAIKWIKKWMKDDAKVYGMLYSTSYELFMKFFNITEEDLK